MPLLWAAGLAGSAITAWLAAPYLETADPRAQPAVTPQDRAMDRAILEGNIARYQQDPGTPPTSPLTPVAYAVLGLGVLAFIAANRKKGRR